MCAISRNSIVSGYCSFTFALRYIIAHRASVVWPSLVNICMLLSASVDFDQARLAMVTSNRLAILVGTLSCTPLGLTEQYIYRYM